MDFAPIRTLILIHGSGCSFADAAALLEQLLTVPCTWSTGSFLVPAREGSAIGRVLRASPTSEAGLLLQQLLLGRLLVASVDGTAPQTDRTVAIDERALLAHAASHSIPVLPSDRYRQGLALLAAGNAPAILDSLPELIDEIHPAGQQPDELQAFERAKVWCAEHGAPDTLPAVIRELRDTAEGGGDLDTVASATLYAHALRNGGSLTDKLPRAFRFVFINYHESPEFLARYAPAGVLAADLPVSAFPGLARHIRALHASGVQFVHFQDHHPCPTAQQQELEALVAAGVLGTLELAGPAEGEELPEADLRCGADLVYDAHVKGTPADTPGAQHLRDLAHSEDFVLDRHALGRSLSALIKSGISKAELAHVLLLGVETDSIEQQLDARGWITRGNDFQAAASKAAEAIPQAYTIPLQSPEGSRTRILVAQAARRKEGGPTVPVGTALQYLSETYPGHGYLFYCYGASMLVARRIDHADATLNLGGLMKRLGTEADGGHAGAAVCRPDANPFYPHRILGRVSPASFPRFVQYLAHRLETDERTVGRVETLHHEGARHLQGSRSKLIITLLAAALAGLVAGLLVPSLRPAAIRTSNLNFFPNLGLQEEAQP